MSNTTANDLAKVINDLMAQRDEHVARIAEIDTLFEQYGIRPPTAATPKKRGRPPGRPKKSVTSAKKAGGGRRKRKTFSQSGEDSVLDFVKKAGKPTTREVNEHWSGEGRGGKADNTLTKLVQQGKLNRENIEGQRGSRYSAV